MKKLYPLLSFLIILFSSSQSILGMIIPGSSGPRNITYNDFDELIEILKSNEKSVIDIMNAFKIFEKAPDRSHTISILTTELDNNETIITKILRSQRFNFLYYIINFFISSGYRKALQELICNGNSPFLEIRQCNSKVVRALKNCFDLNRNNDRRKLQKILYQNATPDGQTALIRSLLISASKKQYRRNFIIQYLSEDLYPRTNEGQLALLKILTHKDSHEKTALDYARTKKEKDAKFTEAYELLKRVHARTLLFFYVQSSSRESLLPNTTRPSESIENIPTSYQPLVGMTPQISSYSSGLELPGSPFSLIDELSESSDDKGSDYFDVFTYLN